MFITKICYKYKTNDIMNIIDKKVMSNKLAWHKASQIVSILIQAVTRFMHK